MIILKPLSVALMGVVGLFLVSCQDQVGTSSETRELTTLDTRPVLLAPTSAQRFDVPGSATSVEAPEEKSSFTYTAPQNWIPQKGTMFRVVNFKLQEGGEIYVSQVGGDVLGNINRWYKQFGGSPVTQEEIEAGARLTILGVNGYYMEASGAYNPGMGKSVAEDKMVLGAVAQVDGQLVTIKLVAEPNIALANKSAFMTFCESLAKN